MNGTVIFNVFALISLSGHLASGRTVAEISEGSQQGPTTYQVGGKHFSDGTVSFIPNQSVAPQNISELLPAGEYFGEITRNSLLLATITIERDNGAGYSVLGLSTNSNVSITFIETFDTSEDGVSGGLIQLIDGGIGDSGFRIGVQPLSANHPLRIVIVAYYESPQSDGRHYRFGHYRPGLERLVLSRASTPARYDAISTLTYSTIFNGEAVYMQSEDSVFRGQGAVYLTEGGIGVNNATFVTLSGYGEAVDRTIQVYGYPDA